MTSVDGGFTPARGLRNGHLMTLAAWAWPRTWPHLPAADIRLIRVDDDSQVRADCFWQRSRSGAPTLLGLHGLEGSSESHYMRGVAEKAFTTGWNVVLLNQRNCGGTEHLTPGLYHSGLTADPIAVLRALHADTPLVRLAIVGYSLGGNLTLKLAGEWANCSDLPLCGVVAVCPTVDLARCVDAIALPGNVMYEWHFLTGLKARMRRKAAAFPGRYDLAPLAALRTIREFDDAYTAPSNGFGTADNYYRQASALRTAGNIAVPSLVLAAADDPFVPAEQFAEPALTSNPFITIEISAHGGHCGFVAPATEFFDGYWAEARALRFLSRC